MEEKKIISEEMKSMKIREKDVSGREKDDKKEVRRREGRKGIRKREGNKREITE